VFSYGVFTGWSKLEKNLEHTSCSCIFNTFALRLLRRVIACFFFLVQIQAEIPNSVSNSIWVTVKLTASMVTGCQYIIAYMYTSVKALHRYSRPISWNRRLRQVVERVDNGCTALKCKALPASLTFDFLTGRHIDNILPWKVSTIFLFFAFFLFLS